MFWLLALIAILMSLRLTPNARMTLFLLAYILLVVFAGLRWETGNDWAVYYEYYQHLSSIHDQPRNQFFEIGYRILSLAIKSTGLPFWGFNLIYAAIYIGLIFASFKHENYSISGWLVLQFYAPFILGLMGTTRQVMAVAICMFGVRYILGHNPIKFLACIVIAASFHISAVAFLFAWPLMHFRLNLWRVWLVFALLAVASLFSVGDRVVQFAEQRVAMARMVDLENKLILEQESSAEEFQPAAGPMAVIIMTIGRIGLLALVVIGFRLYYKDTDQLYLKFYLTAIAIVVLLSGTVYVLAERTAIYFSLFQIHLIALPTERFKTRLTRGLCAAAIIILSMTHLYTGLMLRNPKVFVPYKGLFINQDVRRDLGWF